MKVNEKSGFDKKLSIKNLLTVVREKFNILSPKHKDNRGLKSKISIEDCLMSAFAMFSLKSPSLLSFDEALDDEIVKHNLKSLYKLKNIPSDTYMREKLNLVNPTDLRLAFTGLFKEVQQNKLLEKFYFLKGYLLLLDGTGIFESNKIFCENCCVKQFKDGTKSYYHQILAGVIANPYNKQVLPLCPEPIIKQDGITKNDCESNSTYRFLEHVKKEHPQLHFTITSDALSATSPMINFIKKMSYNYIINVKESSNKSLYEFITGLKLNEIKLEINKNKYKFRYINSIPLNNVENAPNVNFLECYIEEKKGNKINKKTFAWVTSHKISDKNVYDIMLGGRARWKIENETFNTLKNQGYQFEHNFGHGKKNLHTIFAFTMMLAFYVDQIQEATCELFKTAIKSKKTRRSFWERMRMYFHSFLIDDWEELLKSINYGPKALKLISNST